MGHRINATQGLPGPKSVSVIFILLLLDQNNPKSWVPMGTGLMIFSVNKYNPVDSSSSFNPLCFKMPNLEIQNASLLGATSVNLYPSQNYR